MKAFWIYTLARLGVFAVTYLALWSIASIWFDPAFGNLLVFLVAVVVSAVISIFALSGLRNEFASQVHARASRITERIEESRSAEDVD